MEPIEQTLPVDNALARRALYGGTAFCLPANSSSLALVDEVDTLLRRTLKTSDLRAAHRAARPEQIAARLIEARRVLFHEDSYHSAVRRVIESAGFDGATMAFDPLRVRAVLHRAHENPELAAAYYPHRDTWYGHSEAVVTWMIPLHDLSAEETMVLYPDCFRVAIPNNSDQYEYTSWMSGGWGAPETWIDREEEVTALPGVRGRVDCGRPVRFSCDRGSNVLFSASQFHRPLPQENDMSRFYLEFRVVHLGDHEAGLGAPNVDNRCQGSSLVDFVPPQATA